MYKDLVTGTKALSELICSVAGLHLHTTVLVTDYRSNMEAIKGWSGGEPDHKSCGSFISPLKAMELLLDFRKPFAMTPTGYPLGCGWMGGVRRFIEEEDAHYVTSASAWDERCDAQHALLLNYAMTQEVRLHHVGFRHPTKASMLKVVRAEEERYNVEGIEVPAEDHIRFYIPVEAPETPNGIYWREHQWFQKEPNTYAIHWDFVTMNPESLLAFVASHLNTKEITWDAGPNDPVGAIWESNEGVPYGFMARPRWWKVRKG